MRPARAPARTRSVGAAWRTAQIIIANGAMAMIGIERRHSSHSLPTIILSQWELGAVPRLIPASNAITTNGIAAKIDGVLSSPPGLVSLVRQIAATPTSTMANANLVTRKISA